MMRVLVTGAGGFIGSHVVRVLGEQSHEIFAMTRGKRNTNAHSGNPGQIRFVEVDLADDEKVQSELRQIRPDLAIHLAWYAVPGKYPTASENLDCVAATLKFVRALAEVGCKRLVITGSCAEYDWDYGFLSEKCTPLGPRTLYGACKNALHQMVESYCSRISMQLAWTRIFYLFGPGEASVRFVPSLIISLLQGQIAKCTSGEQIRDFSYVEDVAAAIFTVAMSNFTGTVNIGSGKPVRLRTMVETIARMLGCPDRVAFGAVPDDPGEPPLLMADVRRLNRDVGWTPSLTLEEALMRTVDWWKVNL